MPLKALGSMVAHVRGVKAFRMDHELITTGTVFYPKRLQNDEFSPLRGVGRARQRTPAQFALGARSTAKNNRAEAMHERDLLQPLRAPPGVWPASQERQAWRHAPREDEGMLSPLQRRTLARILQGSLVSEESSWARTSLRPAACPLEVPRPHPHPAFCCPLFCGLRPATRGSHGAPRPPAPVPRPRHLRSGLARAA